MFFFVGGVRVTICRDARLVRSLYQNGTASVPVKNHYAVTFDATDAVPSFGDGRTSRASLQRVTRPSRYTYRAGAVR